MALMKVQFLYNWGGKRFSETHYIDGNFDPLPNGISEKGTLSKALLLAKARGALLCGADAAVAQTGPNRPVFVGYRMSEQNVVNGISRPYTAPDQIANVNATETTPGDRDNTAVLSAFSVTGSQRNILLKAIPSKWVTGDPSVRKGQVPNGMAAKLDPYITRLVADGWGVRVQTLAGEQPITFISTAETGHWQITVPGGVYQINQPIYIKGARGPGLRGFGGPYRVLNITEEGDLILNAKKCDPCPIDPTSRGNVYTRTFALSRYLDVNFAGWGDSILGNGNFFAEDGRRRDCCR